MKKIKLIFIFPVIVALFSIFSPTLLNESFLIKNEFMIRILRILMGISFVATMIIFFRISEYFGISVHQIYLMFFFISFHPAVLFILNQVFLWKSVLGVMLVLLNLWLSIKGRDSYWSLVLGVVGIYLAPYLLPFFFVEIPMRKVDKWNRTKYLIFIVVFLVSIYKKLHLVSILFAMKNFSLILIKSIINSILLFTIKIFYIVSHITSFSDIFLYFTLALVLAIIYIFFRYRSRYRLLFLFIIGFVFSSFVYLVKYGPVLNNLLAYLIIFPLSYYLAGYVAQISNKKTKNAIILGISVYLLFFTFKTAFLIWQQDKLWLNIIKAYPSATVGYAYSAEYFEKRGDTPRAREYYLKAYEHSNKKEFLEKALLYSIAQKKYEEALVLLNKIVKARSEPEFLYYRAQVKNALGRYQSAISDLQACIDSGYKTADIFYEYGLALYFQKNYDAAVTYFNKAIEISEKPKGSYFFQLGMCYIKKNQYEKAYELFKKALVHFEPTKKNEILAAKKNLHILERLIAKQKSNNK